MWLRLRLPRPTARKQCYCFKQYVRSATEAMQKESRRGGI